MSDNEIELAGDQPVIEFIGGEHVNVEMEIGKAVENPRHEFGHEQCLCPRADPHAHPAHLAAGEQLDLARQLGATDAFNAGDPDIVEKVKEATGGGVDYAFEMAGSVPALELAYKITRRGGTTVTAGLANPAKAMSLFPVTLVAEERTLKGSYVGSCVPKRDIPRYIDLFRRGRLPVDRLLSETIEGLEGLNEAFDRLADGATVRQILIP